MPLLPLSRPCSFAFGIILATLSLALLGHASAPTAFWPASISRDVATVWLGEPTLESWDYLSLRLSAPVTYQQQGAERQTGRVALQARTFPNRPAQTVTLSDFQVVSLQLSGGGEADARQRADLEAVFGDLHPTIPLDVLIDAFSGSKEIASVAVSSEVPRIFVSTAPAILLQFDGAPMWLPVEGSKISFAVNTNWDVFYDNKSTFFYLLVGDTWLATHDPFSGEWVVPKSLPKELKTLPRTADFAHVWKHLPYRANPDAVLPKVFYTETAAELIRIDGEPKQEEIAQTGIFAVTNASSDLFRHGAAGAYYLLVAGRWFATNDLNGYWRNAGRLPEGFGAIPKDHPKASVLTHVPGTPESLREAFRATVPHLATIRRKGPEIRVEFAGRPQYVPIDGTSLLWVSNATVPIVAQGGKLYACHHGVWFTANGAKGPWEVAASLPADIYQIPPRSPVYHLSFVRLVSSDEKTVTFGYTGGYENLVVSDGVVVYGTGFRHEPALQYGAYTYPIYFAQPSTYGVGAWYDPARHVFLRGKPGYGPFGGFGATCRFNSVTSHYFRAQTLYGDDLGDEPSLAFLPYTAAYGKLTDTYDPYSTWGDAVLAGGRRAGSPHPIDVRASLVKGTVPVSEPGTAVSIQVGEPVVGPPNVSLPKPEAGFQPPKRK